MFCTIYCKHWFNKHYSINVSKKLSKKQTGNLLFYTNPVVSFTKIDLLGLCLQLPQFLDFSEKSLVYKAGRSQEVYCRVGRFLYKNEGYKAILDWHNKTLEKKHTYVCILELTN